MKGQRSRTLWVIKAFFPVSVLDLGTGYHVARAGFELYVSKADHDLLMSHTHRYKSACLRRLHTVTFHG